MADGVLIVRKEPGYSSGDVVGKLRGILHQRRIGHTGTLDPAAEGVLPVCLGRATRLVDVLTDRTKTYRAVLLLGTQTDTQDTTGQVLRTVDLIPDIAAGRLTEETVRRAAEAFVGDYDQVPPMYSALKVNGKRLYELARQGIVTERRARRVQILSLTVDEVQLPRVTMTVTCSKGTYIRTLCHDIGERLGCGGCMAHLLRTRVGQFTLEEALTLEEIRSLAEGGELEQYIIPPDRVLGDLPAWHFDHEEADRRLHNGNSLSGQWGRPQSAGSYRVYDRENQFIGVYRYDEAADRWKAEKIFL